MNFNKAEFENAYGFSGMLPESEKPEIAFAGRSNVGKSSLLNKIFNRKNLARVSSVPGKTININFYNVDGERFVDLPGYGYAKISKSERARFSELTEGYFQSGRNIRMVVQLIDMRHKPSVEDFEMISFLKQLKIPFIVVLTKADKLKKKEYANRLNAFYTELSKPKFPVIPFSAVTGIGTDEIKKAIEKALKAQEEN
ncbi:MAG: ribosome biogenesis GTP-binding protein YihA/YsxC [Clostridiales bacterium]|nr:ribosome biogenesis GTP-binding protein YihA/YsxC [Clostridiales bacterium]